MKLSGKLILHIATLPTSSTQTCVDKIWNKDNFCMAQKCKPNIMDCFYCHGSIGNCYLFGNKTNYLMG